MFSRLLAIFGILLALLGVIVVPGIFAFSLRRRILAIHQNHKDDGDNPWDLTGFIPVGYPVHNGNEIENKWAFYPGFKKVE